MSDCQTDITQNQRVDNQFNVSQDLGAYNDNSIEDISLSDCMEEGDNESNHGDDGSNHDGDYGDPGEEHEFEIIDQLESEEDDGIGTERSGNDRQRNEDQDDYSSSSDDLDDTELHAMLEKGIDKDSIKKPDENQDGRPIIKHKIVLNELESDPFDILPEGWVWVTHNCGMPVYLHKETRVCTMARPYSLGSASARTHDIPISAIPCLQYRRQMEKLKPESQVDDCKNDSSNIEVKNSFPTEPVKTNSAVSIEVDNSKESLKQPSVNNEKKSPGKLWVVAEESSEFKTLDSQYGALHTGVGDYKTYQLPELNTSEAPSSLVCENIAVRLDRSCLDDSENINAHALGETGFEASISSASENLSVEVNAQNLGSQQNLNADPEEKEKHLIGSCAVNAKHGQCSEKPLICPMSWASVGENLPSTYCLISQKNLHGDDTNASKIVTEDNLKSLVAVVAEEATSNTERSELVTSNTNPLASIKRKIESLKNKRGGKHRKLDNGSATGWPTDNNIAVSARSSGRDDTFNGAPIPNADEKLKAHAAEVKIKSAEERAKESLLDSSTVHDYCTKLFQFKTLEVKKYRSWRERRKHLGERSRRNRPELPPSTKLITCPIPGNMKSEGTGDNAKKREFILNPTGKSYLCILHEYMQRTLKIQPLYVFKELENSKTPYGATVMINNIEYGTGYASSKKVAKQEAAKETLKVLIPDLFKKITDQEIKRNISDLSFFDDVKVTDPRVNELGNKVGQPSPFQLLLECLRRNFGMGNTQCEVSTKALKNQKCEFTINVGKHSATVVAKNKREGKQLAAQAILAKLHPHVPSWGSLLRLYGTSVEKAIQKPEEMNDVKSHAPNHSVLESLRDEMRKLHRQKEAIQSKGKMIISSKDLPSKMSGVDL
ncbi:microprocessor complex subunit DGCR8 [Biomphalaria pfeifferi]|uniref:Microprocessor complex subunit DGCR8 n=1 Tax=Biomphalaria pfeifferi TaxID=112525 RepID=A0AAD8BIG3_BIOPF|nr:microprocessor complex subunit DGCR8 [Biomphalaria pfeifferi]